MDESLAFRNIVLAVLFAMLTTACALLLGAALSKERDGTKEDWPMGASVPWFLAMVLSALHVVRFLVSAYEAMR